MNQIFRSPNNIVRTSSMMPEGLLKQSELNDLTICGSSMAEYQQDFHSEVPIDSLKEIGDEIIMKNMTDIFKETS